MASKYGWHGNFVNSADGGCVLKEGNVQGTGKDDPTNKYFDLLKLLSYIAAALGLLLLLAGFLQKSVVPATMAFGFAMAKACGALASNLTQANSAVSAAQSTTAISASQTTSIVTGSVSTASNLYGDFTNVDPRHWNPDTQQWD